MKNTRAIAGLALALMMPLTAAAEIGWDHVDVRYTGYDASGVSGDGFGIAGAMSIGDSTHLIGAYDDLTIDVLGFDVGLTYWRVGFGGHRDLSDKVVGYSEFTYESIEASFGAFSAEDNGYGFRLGLRGMVAESLELNGGIRYVDIGVSDTLLGLGAVWSVGERFALTAGYEDGDDSFYTLGGRFSF